MILHNIAVRNFRNFEDASFDFDKNLTLIVGENARGKTNLLEAIHFIINGKGIKDDKQEELMLHDAEEADVSAKLSDGNSDLLLRIYMKSQGDISKTFFIDRAKRSSSQYTQQTPPVVIFSPSLISIVDEQPAKRRRFVDATLSKFDPEYKKRLNNYENALRKRNRVLEQARSEEKVREELNFWDVYLIENGSYVTDKRQWFVDQLNTNTSLDRHTFSAEYDKNEMTLDRLEETFKKQMRLRRTVIGPQRDDFAIYKVKGGKKVHTSTYCSRGEQRLALFWLILHQLRIFDENLELKPILLLDDIFSELDQANKKSIVDLIHHYQTIITTTENELIEHPSFKGTIIKI